MKKIWMCLCVVPLAGCVTKPPSSASVFANAQAHYLSKESDSMVRKRDLQMPSYFFNTEYKQHQVELTASQENRINSLLKKSIYPEEYKLYVSFGLGNENNVNQLKLSMKRGEFIKARYAGKVKKIQIAYIKNQQSDTAYFRLIV
jgi:hypothetical protein